MSSFKRTAPACALAAAIAAGTPSARAADFVPTSGTHTWNSADNWNPTGVPNASGAAAVFDTPGAARVITVDSGAAGFTVGSVAFTNNSAVTNSLQAGTAGSNLILNNGGNGVTLTFNGSGPTLANNTISVPMVFNDSVTAAVNYTSNSTTSITTQGAFNWTGAVSGGAGGFTKTGPGTMTFGTAAKQYTGPTVFDTGSGRTRISTSGSPTATSSVTVRAGAQLELISAGTYTFGSGPLNLNGNGTPAFAGSIRPASHLAITIANATVLQSSTIITSAGRPADSSITFAGTVSGPGALTVDGGGAGNSGTIALNGANTYSGGSIVNLGTLLAGTIAGPSSPAASLGTGNVTVNNNNAFSALQIQTGVTNAIADAATLSLAGGGGPGADGGFAFLSTGVNEVVGSLVLGGLTQLPGTYGSSSSLATNRSDEFFAGTGIITVGVVPEPAGLGLAVVGGVGLLSRRRRRRGGQTSPTD